MTTNTSKQIPESSKNDTRGVNTQIVRSDAKIYNLETDMDDGMLMFVKEIFSDKFYTSYSNQELAERLKDNFEKKYYPTWICIVGKSFGCNFEAQPKHYLRFQLEDKIIILYKFK